MKFPFIEYESFVKLCKDGSDVNRYLAFACLYGYEDLVSLMIEKGANNWNWGMAYACQSGHKKLVLLMIEKGANDWDGSLYEACRGRYIELADIRGPGGGTPG